MSRRRLRHIVTFVATLFLAGAAVWLRHDDESRRGSPQPGRPARAPTTVQTVWSELHEPALTDDPADDGDSFVVRHRDGQHILRLYFVDCPEKRRHQFNRERLADQGAAFGGLTETDTLQIGREARNFTLNLLQNRQFRVHTRWEPVYDDRRHYAHVAVIEADGRQRWLAELLVEAGLARIHTKGADLPDGTSRHAFEHRLRSLEKTARLAGRGGWADFAARETSRER